MKTLIRIEHPDSGDGVFRAKNETGAHIYDKSKFSYAIDNRHGSFKPPRLDNIIDFTDKHYCAFKSIEQLQQWILTEELKDIISLGFKVYMLDVEDCLEGEYQYCYTKDSILQSKDITSLFI